MNQKNRKGECMYFQQNTSEPETLPISAVAFRRYLAAYQIELLDVALKSGVRYMTVWRVGQGQPINSQDEILIRQGLLRMTGIPYAAPLLVHGQE
jgi:hypothetical protein